MRLERLVPTDQALQRIVGPGSSQNSRMGRPARLPAMPPAAHASLHMDPPSRPTVGTSGSYACPPRGTSTWEMWIHWGGVGVPGRCGRAWKTQVRVGGACPPGRRMSAWDVHVRLEGACPRGRCMSAWKAHVRLNGVPEPSALPNCASSALCKLGPVGCWATVGCWSGEGADGSDEARAVEGVQADEGAGEGGVDDL